MQQPLILFVDDLQWCDKECLEILAAMVEESAEITNFLLLGGYRDDNEQSRNHIQSCLVDRILCTSSSSSSSKQQQQQQPWTDIAIGNLNVDCVNAMIADVLTTSSSIKNIDNNNDDNNDPNIDDMKYQDDDNIQINDRKNDNSFLELGRFVHSKTKGNPYFVLQFLGILKREHLLSFNDKVSQWEWDIHNIQTKLFVTTASSNSTSNSSNNIITKNNSTNASSSVPETNDDVSYFVTQRILTLSPDLRRILKLAACLGFSINLKLLETLDRMELQSHQEKIVGTGLPLQLLETATVVMDHAGLFQRAIDQAAAEQLLHCVGGGGDDGTTVCTFTHDRVQQCVYELIPEERIRDELHFRTGKNLLHLYQERQEQEQEQQETQEGHLIVNQDTELLFLAADQCNRGSTCIEHLDHERKALIQLNLQASQVARSKAGASLVALFLDKAVALTRVEDWRSSMFYGIVLEVHSLSAEVDSARGSYDRSNARVEVILNKAMCREDMVRAIAVQAQSHGAQQEYTAALSKMKRALTILGVKMPPSGKLRFMMEIWKLKRLLKHKTEDDFLLLPSMTDKRMMLAMKILQMGVIWGWNADVYFGLLSYVVMVQISLTYGRCYLTPFVFAGLGNILANLFGDDAKGYWFCQLARRFDEGKEAFPATTMVVHCYLSHLRKPASESLETLLAAYRVSLETGDLYMGTICICVYHWVYKFCGLPLGNFVTDLRSYLAELKLCQQDYLLAFLLPDLYLALNLKGESESPLVISWDVIERAESFTYKTVLANQHLTHPAELNRCYTQMFNAIVLGDIECMEKTMHLIVARKKAFRRFDGSHIANQFFAFWDGLASFALLRRKRSRRYRGVANQSIKVLTQMSTGGSVNCVGMLHLLKAEKASLHFAPTQEIDKFLYDDAISQLFRSGFAHFSAIANERAGEFMLRRKDQYWAQHYLSRALALYKKWGALVKIHQLQEKYSFVMTSDDGFRGVEVAVHGRRRYSATLDSLKHVSGDHSSLLERLDSSEIISA